jgi:BirA family biotin operon repressor/biotin-[acetyl-CoA-carboxylase] ligase
VNENLDDLFDVHVIDSTPSTNLLAREAGAAKKIGLYIALTQTSGRGRRGKTWISNTNEGLWFSFLLNPEVEPETASMLTLLFGLCIMKALQSACNIQVGIKWPNDIVSLHNGKKLCGILSEMSMEDNQISYAVVGCGINVSQTSFPQEIQAVTTGLNVLMAVLKEVNARYAAFEHNPFGFLPEYRANCVTLGREVRIESEQIRDGTEKGVLTGTANGIATGISDTGDLLVQLEDGTARICRSGEVSVRGILGYL